MKGQPIACQILGGIRDGELFHITEGETSASFNVPLDRFNVPVVLLAQYNVSDLVGFRVCPVREGKAMWNEGVTSIRTKAEVKEQLDNFRKQQQKRNGL